jgi:hypothetical protein
MMHAATRVKRIILVTVALAALPRPVSAATQCVEYGTASLAGTLVRQTYPGPPDYESVRKGDEPQIIWVLQLEERTCAYSDSTYTPRYGEREVQLVLEAEQYAQYRQFLGKRLIVTGELVRGSAQHEKRLVLIVREIEEKPTLSSDAYPDAPLCLCR